MPPRSEYIWYIQKLRLLKIKNKTRFLLATLSSSRSTRKPPPFTTHFVPTAVIPSNCASWPTNIRRHGKSAANGKTPRPVAARIISWRIAIIPGIASRWVRRTSAIWWWNCVVRRCIRWDWRWPSRSWTIRRWPRRLWIEWRERIGRASVCSTWIDCRPASITLFRPPICRARRVRFCWTLRRRRVSWWRRFRRLVFCVCAYILGMWMYFECFIFVYVFWKVPARLSDKWLS